MQPSLSEHKHLDLLIIIKQAKSNHTQNQAQQRSSVKKIPYIHHSLPPARRCMNKLLKGLLCGCICHRPAQRDASARTYMPKYKECYLLDSLHDLAHKTIQATQCPNYLKISSTRSQMARPSNLLSQSLLLPFHPVATIVLCSFNTKAIHNCS